MMRRMIVVQTKDKRDVSLTKAEVDAFDPHAAISQVQKIAEEHPMDRSDEEVGTLYEQFIAGLPEPRRTMFVRHRAGQRYSEIADAMGLGKKLVLKTLAKTYADLRFALTADGAHNSLTL